MATVIVIAIVAVLVLWKLSSTHNSHRLPQSVHIPEFRDSTGNPELEGVEKGYTLKLSRELGELGYHLFVTISVNGKDLSRLRQIIFSWDKWPQRIFNFIYPSTDDRVDIQGDQIRIIIGSFNNCPGSTNFLKRTYYTDFMKIDLLDYEPEYDDFEYEKDKSTQSVFCPCMVRSTIKQFRKGLHYVNS
ncbi:MAG TPA: hypothetical protein PLT37_02030 [Kiritimatiellia bacterium]|nr:hypothetical protein [Kiritimatiellia bacterium]